LIFSYQKIKTIQGSRCGVYWGGDWGEYIG